MFFLIQKQRTLYTCFYSHLQIGVSKNRGFSPQIIHLFIGFSIINHPFWGTPVFGNTQTTRPKRDKRSTETVPRADCNLERWKTSPSQYLGGVFVQKGPRDVSCTCKLTPPKTYPIGCKWDWNYLPTFTIFHTWILRVFFRIRYIDYMYIYIYQKFAVSRRVQCQQNPWRT